MRTWVSDPKPIRKFLRNFLLRSRKKFKLFFWLASQPASGPGPMDQGRTRAQAGAHGPGPDPGPLGQGHGPGPGPMDRAIILEAANAADFKRGCGAEPPPQMKKVIFSGCPSNPGDLQNITCQVRPHVYENLSNFQVCEEMWDTRYLVLHRVDDML